MNVQGYLKMPPMIKSKNISKINLEITFVMMAKLKDPVMFRKWLITLRTSIIRSKNPNSLMKLDRNCPPSLPWKRILTFMLKIKRITQNSIVKPANK